MTKVAVLVGSLRRASFSRKLALALIDLAPGLDCTIVELGDLPVYNQDFDDDGAPPPAYTAFRAAMAGYDAVLFVTPEYNRSVPGVLKNALDVGSRPYGTSVWSGKPAAVVSCSPGAMGGFGANHHLRQSFVFLDMPAMQQPEAYLGNVTKLFADDGSVVPASAEFLTKIMAAFAGWIERTAPKSGTSNG